MSDDTRNENISLSIQLLQPELLLKSTLIDILRSRCVSGDLISWDKEKLVDLYRRVVLPLAQRIITSSWRKNSQKISTKGKITGPDLKEERSYKIGFNGLTSPRSSIGSSTTKDRLKPPPDCSSQGNKKLKISCGDDTKQPNKTSESSTSDPKKTPATKVALKRPCSQTKECQSSPSKVVCTKAANEEKKVKSKITWP
ncbi:hypothetical protein LSTR_LSTR012487 [Laodelphax striatellus]|uniref:Uncharacterized protein n=1 Tax=Laodelphax striatellus TaxID=195883 RepID=A0A482XKT5_LAOST|nr:hypothetical protein LSTR_LSTR012487 [Laodelphax striatellus]